MEVLYDLVGYSNRKLYQNSDWFCFSLDSILLANFVTLSPKTKRILDLGTGTAPIPLILSLYTKAKIVGLEIQQDLATLAQKSIQYNHLEEQIQILPTDMKIYASQMQSDQFDIIVSNPPYFKATNQSYYNQELHKTIARHEVTIQLEEIFQIAKKLLKNKGIFAIVHRTERLVELLNLFQKYGLEPKKIQFVYPKKDMDSNIVLIEGMKNGKSGLKLLAPLYIHKEDGTYSKEYLAKLEMEKQ